MDPQNAVMRGGTGKDAPSLELAFSGTASSSGPWPNPSSALEWSASARAGSPECGGVVFGGGSVGGVGRREVGLGAVFVGGLVPGRPTRSAGRNRGLGVREPPDAGERGDALGLLIPADLDPGA